MAVNAQAQIAHRQPRSQETMDLMLRNLPTARTDLRMVPCPVPFQQRFEASLERAGLQIPRIFGGADPHFPELDFSYTFTPSEPLSTYSPIVWPTPGLPQLEITASLREVVKIPRLDQTERSGVSNEVFMPTTFRVTWLFTLDPELTDQKASLEKLKMGLLKAGVEQFATALAESYKRGNLHPAFKPTFKSEQLSPGG